MKQATKTTKKPAPKVTRNRRSPYELLQDLRAKRFELCETSARKIGKLDAKIESLDARYQQRIAVEELKATKTPEELEQEIADLKERQKLIQAARKGKRAEVA